MRFGSKNFSKVLLPTATIKSTLIFQGIFRWRQEPYNQQTKSSDLYFVYCWENCRISFLRNSTATLETLRPVVIHVAQIKISIPRSTLVQFNCNCTMLFYYWLRGGRIMWPELRIKNDKSASDNSLGADRNLKSKIDDYARFTGNCIILVNTRFAHCHAIT